MTANEALNQVAQVRPFAYPQEMLGRWVMELEGSLWTEFFSKYEGADGSGRAKSYPEDGDVTLLVPDEWANVYTLYLLAMVDFYDRNWTAYSGSNAMYSAALDEFRKEWHRTHRRKDYDAGVKNLW